VKHLNLKAWLALAALAVVMGLLIFVPAGTTSYWQGWAYLAIFFAAGAVMTLDLMKRDPALLERRMSGGPTAEKRPIQKFIMWWASIAFIAMLVVPALDYRIHGASLPPAVNVAGDLLVAIGFLFIFFVYRENTFTSATIEVAADQKVISTGPYAIVRHPMYASASLYILGTPLALGSLWAFVPVGVMIPFLIWRMFDEERFLAQNLPGYVDYQKRVRHRVIPFLW
jgi:protein-S-isoprenylcysteine O-methyltransferase Ste14